jgi:hypothetical protein
MFDGSDIPMTNGYTSGLFDCLTDIGGCLTLTFCGWTLIPSACIWADARAEDCRPCHCICGVPPIWHRRVIRDSNGIHTSQYCGDCCLYLFCCPCATCQDCREVKVLKAQRGSASMMVTIIPGRGIVVVADTSGSSDSSGFRSAPIIYP